MNRIRLCVCSSASSVTHVTSLPLLLLGRWRNVLGEGKAHEIQFATKNIITRWNFLLDSSLERTQRQMRSMSSLTAAGQKLGLIRSLSDVFPITWRWRGLLLKSHFLNFFPLSPVSHKMNIFLRNTNFHNGKMQIRQSNEWIICNACHTHFSFLSLPLLFSLSSIVLWQQSD